MGDGRWSKRKEKTPEQALAALMWVCARAEKSSGDALRLMRQWNVEPAECQGVIDRLVADGFIDDRRYAAAYVREKVNLAGWGRHKIEHRLVMKGVAREIIAAELDLLDRGAQSERLDAMLARKLRSLKVATDYELRTKLFRYAMGLGYDYEVVTAAVDRVVSAAKEDLER